MLNQLFCALRFLTVFKLGTLHDEDFAKLGQSSWAFPVVGIIIGFILVGVHYSLHGLLNPLCHAVILVTLWIFLTGGLHMDGWVDCWDSLAAPVPPEKRLLILKDSRIGTFGAVSLLCIFLLKVAALSHEPFPPHMLFLAPVAGRTIMLLVGFRAPRKSEGMGSSFIDTLSMRSLLKALVVASIVVLYSGLLGIIATLTAYAGSVYFRRFAVRRLTVVTGDVIGASCELSECLVLTVGAMGLHHV